MKTSTIFLLISSTLLFITGIFFAQKKQHTKHHTTTIGIIQTASHPALDAVNSSLVTRLNELFGTSISLIQHNAQGNQADLHSIALQLHSDDAVDGIVAIATPALQSIASIEHTKPLFFAAVTDPTLLGVEKMANVCGITDMINVKEQIGLIQRLKPTAKTVALLFNPGEINSSTLAQKLAAELAARALIVHSVGITSADMVGIATQQACDADVILTPTDNLVAATFPLIASIAEQHATPIFVCDNMLVEQGALAGNGADYHQAGSVVANFIHNVFAEGKTPEEIGIHHPENTMPCINMDDRV